MIFDAGLVTSDSRGCHIPGMAEKRRAHKRIFLVTVMGSPSLTLLHRPHTKFQVGAMTINKDLSEEVMIFVGAAVSMYSPIWALANRICLT